jgi:hypothetical protein
MSKTSRRALLLCAILSGQALLPVCGGAGSNAFAQGVSNSEGAGSANPVRTSTPTPTLAPVQSGSWTLQNTLAMVLGSSATLALKSTQPAGVVAGSDFEVDRRDSPQPDVVRLGADGVISLSAGVIACVIPNVVFAYIAP